MGKKSKKKKFNAQLQAEGFAQKASHKASHNSKTDIDEQTPQDARMEKLSSMVLLGILSFFTYINALFNDFISDDIQGILQNPNIGDWGFAFSSPIGFLQPVLYNIAYALGGMNPVVFRLYNVLAHIGAVILIYLILRKLHNARLAFIAGALFAVHPILVESITWISGGTFAWYSFFFLLSLYLYISHVRTAGYVGSLIAYVFAMLAGVPAIVLAVMIPIYEFSYGNIQKNWKKTLAYFGLAALFVAGHFANLGARVSSFQQDHYQENMYTNPLVQIPPAVVKYLELLAWPNKLTLYQSELNYTVPQFVVIYIVFASLIAFTVYSMIYKRHYFFWLALFFVPLSPTLTPIRVTWVVAERYAYLSTLGIIVVFVFLFNRYILTNARTRTAGYVVLVLIITALFIRSVMRNAQWKDADTLYLSMATTSPSDPKTHNNIGDVYGRRGEYDKAIASFQQAIAINPRYADAMHNMANQYVQMQQFDEAVKWYGQAIENNPNLWQSYMNIGIIAFTQKNPDIAFENMNKALEVYPQNPEVFANMALMYLEINENDKALEYAQKTLQLYPENPKALQVMTTLGK